MQSYSALEKRAGLTDVVPATDYRDRAHRMGAAFRELLKQRPRIVGHDLMPGFDEVRLWSTIVCGYSLLEQSLKLLVGVRTTGYLSSDGKETARTDGHDLAKIYSRLSDLDRGLLEETFAEYASFLEFHPSFPSLKTYLDEIGKGQVAWRYFLLQNDLTGPRELPSPLSPDVLLEIIRAILDILMAKGWADHGLHGVHHRLRHSLGEALAHHSPLGDLTSADLNDWIRDGHGVVNAFARYLRAGALEDYSDAMRNWLDDSVRIARNYARENNDTDLDRFLALAPTCCVAVERNRFSFSCRRPMPVDADPRLHCHWSIEWCSDGLTWRGEVDDCNHIALPVREGQQFRASWAQCKKPTQEELAVGTKGRLKVFREGRQLASLNAWVAGGGRGGWGPIEADGPTEHATFIVLAEGSDVAAPRELTCDCCRGTGFCPTCKGSPADTGCGDCSPTGLCASCRGYGRDGDHIVASSG